MYVRVGGSYNFVTECFFLTLRCLHVGYLRTCTRYVSLLRSVHEQQQIHKDLLQRRPEWITVQHLVQTIIEPEKKGKQGKRKRKSY
jgi:hypothetical protein